MDSFSCDVCGTGTPTAFACVGSAEEVVCPTCHACDPDLGEPDSRASGLTADGYMRFLRWTAG